MHGIQRVLLESSGSWRCVASSQRLAVYGSRPPGSWNRASADSSRRASLPPLRRARGAGRSRRRHARHPGDVFRRAIVTWALHKSPFGLPVGVGAPAAASRTKSLALRLGPRGIPGPRPRASQRWPPIPCPSHGISPRPPSSSQRDTRFAPSPTWGVMSSSSSAAAWCSARCSTGKWAASGPLFSVRPCGGAVGKRQSAGLAEPARTGGAARDGAGRTGGGAGKRDSLVMAVASAFGEGAEVGGAVESRDAAASGRDGTLRCAGSPPCGACRARAPFPAALAPVSFVNYERFRNVNVSSFE